MEKKVKIEPIVHFIVRKDDNMLYLINPNNKKQVSNAQYWAGKDYQELEFPNGTFDIEILDAAASHTGGKFAFWTVLINGTYKIGINSELLCDFIRENTLENGKASNVYIGKYGSAVGIFSGPEKNPTTDYEPGAYLKGIGVYCGEFIVNGTFDSSTNTFDPKPVKKYIYRESKYWNYLTYSNEKKPGYVQKVDKNFNFKDDYAKWYGSLVEDLRNTKNLTPYYVKYAISRSIEIAALFTPGEIEDLIKHYNESVVGKDDPIHVK